jgi:hypothetical protein
MVYVSYTVAASNCSHRDAGKMCLFLPAEQSTASACAASCSGHNNSSVNTRLVSTRGCKAGPPVSSCLPDASQPMTPHVWLTRTTHVLHLWRSITLPARASKTLKLEGDTQNPTHRLYQWRSTTLPACDSSFSRLASFTSRTSSCTSKWNSGPLLPRACDSAAICCETARGLQAAPLKSSCLQLAATGSSLWSDKISLGQIPTHSAA